MYIFIAFQKQQHEEWSTGNNKEVRKGKFTETEERKLKQLLTGN